MVNKNNFKLFYHDLHWLPPFSKDWYTIVTKTSTIIVNIGTNNIYKFFEKV